MPTRTDDRRTRTPASARPARIRLIPFLLIAVAALAVVAALGIWYLMAPAPEAVSIGAAAQAVTGDEEASTGETAREAVAAAAPEATEAVAAAALDATPPAGGTADGTWTVDTSVGAFSVTDTAGTFVGFRIDEELANVGATTAVGRTPDVSGTLTIDGTTLAEASFEADLTTIKSDQSRRERAIQNALDTATNPTAAFALTGPVDRGATLTEGQTVTADATGELTVNGTTRQVTVPLAAVWSDEVIVVTGSLDVPLTEYGVAAPSAPMVVSVADTATVELQLYLAPA